MRPNRVSQRKRSLMTTPRGLSLLCCLCTLSLALVVVPVVSSGEAASQSGMPQAVQSASGRSGAYVFGSTAHFASLLPANSPAGSSAPMNSPPPANYDEQIGTVFWDSFTSMAYSVSAVEQTDSVSGAGPAYLLNGLSDQGYWYQVGISWRWPYLSGGHTAGWGMNYEVFDPSGDSIFPTDAGGLASLSGVVNEGDSVMLHLYFSGNTVVMSVHDQNTGASASESYSAFGASQFSGSTTPFGSGFFTGLMTEFYYANPYYGDQIQVTYSEHSYALTAAWMFMDEYLPSTGQLLFSACPSLCLLPTDYSNPTQLQSFSSNGANEYSSAYVFMTGSQTSPPPAATLTLSYSVKGGGSYSPPTLTYISDGVRNSTLLTQYPTAYSVDVGTQWSVSYTLPNSGPTERWQTNQATSGIAIANSSQTISFTYYHQYYLSFAYSVHGGGSGYSPPTVLYVSFSVTNSAPAGALVWVDAYSYYSFTNPLSGSTTSERWDSGPTVGGSVASAGTIAASYFNQFHVSISYQVIGGGNSGSPYATVTSFGQTEAGYLTGFPSGEVEYAWLDAGSSYQFSSLLENSTSTERWDGSGASGSVSGSTSISPTYYHQFEVSMGYSVIGGGSPSPPSLGSTQLGQPLQQPLAVTPSAYWQDAGASWSLTATLGGNTSMERWQTNSVTTGVVSASFSVVPHYYHQFSVTVSYSLVGGGSPTVPMFSGTQFGQTYDAALSRTPTAYWLDSGGQWEVPNLLGGSTAQERWLTTQQANGIISQSTTIQLNYDHQYYLTVGLAPAAGGSANIQNGWNEANSTLQIVATANPGWKFEGWTGTGTGSSSAKESSISVIFSDPINESAVFYPGLTMTAGNGGSVSYSAGTAVSAGIVQGSTTSTVYVPPGTTVTLRESPSSFLYESTGWTGGATGTNGTISVTLNAPTTVKADFSYNYVNIGGITAAIVAVAAVVAVVLRRRGAAKQ